MSGSLRPATSDYRPSAGSLARVVYRSRAIGNPSPSELETLTETSKARNRREAVTGVMLYDDSRYFQWLEGPADGVDRIMGSIRNDRRHTDIEVLSEQTAPSRTFGDWSMKLATPSPKPTFRQADVIDPPREIVETLRRQPEAAPVVLVRLLPVAARAADSAMTEVLARMPLQADIADILRGVLLSTVLPGVAARVGDHRLLPPQNPRAAELADLLIAPDPAAAAELIRELDAGNPQPGRRYTNLFEPAARILGDLWGEDYCSEFDVTLGLCRLQAAIRMLGTDVLAKLPAASAHPVVLITPEPGELHRLGASFDADVLWQAGWAPKVEFPADDAALQELVSTTWVDVLDLSLSTAFRREDRLASVAETIVQARIASQNPALMVVVGGRTFFERDTDAQDVGADLATRTAAQVDRAILQTLATGTLTATPQVSN